jgi:hypothetical protein
MSDLDKAIAFVRRGGPYVDITLEMIQEADYRFNLGPGDCVRLRHRFCFW